MSSTRKSRSGYPNDLAAEIARLRARVTQLEDLCGEAYQLAGVVGAPVRVLDRMSAAANGDPIPEGTFLPLYAEECHEVAAAREALAEARATADRQRGG